MQTLAGVDLILLNTTDYNHANSFNAVTYFTLTDILSLLY